MIACRHGLAGERRHPPHRSRQRGMVLITSLLLLVVVTILAIGMFRSIGLQEQIAGNVRDKQRAAERGRGCGAIRRELSSPPAVPLRPAACAGPPSDRPGLVCTLTLQAQGINPASLPWTVGGATVGVTYAPPGPTPMTARHRPDDRRRL